MDTTNRTRRSATERSILIGTLTAFALQSGDAAATVDCFDFSTPPPGTEYEVDGAPISTALATIRVQPFLIGTTPVEDDGRGAMVIGSDLPSWTPPSLELVSATIQVKPEATASAISFDYSQNTGADDRQRKNFGVNGERLTDLLGGLEQIDGREIGRVAFGGRAAVSVDAALDDPANLPTFERGTVTVSALDESIELVAIGGHGRLQLDNFCVHSD